MDRTRIACVGDSITFGVGVADRVTESYPAVLQRLLGDQYEVGNFGESGATMLNRGNRPYVTLKKCERATAFNANIVVILLGTNDAKDMNWPHKADFIPDAVAMVQRFKTPGTAVWLCHSVAAPGPETWGIHDEWVREQGPMIRQAAKIAGTAGVIDLYPLTEGRQDLFADGIQPNAAGAALIARTVHAALVDHPAT